MLVYEKKIKMADGREVPTLAVSYTNLPQYDETDQGNLDYDEQGIYAANFTDPATVPSGWNLGSGGGGSSSYAALPDKPKINGQQLVGDKTGESLGLQSKLTAGTNVTISGTTISAVDTKYTAADSTLIVDATNKTIKSNFQAGDGIEITGNVIKAKDATAAAITVTQPVGGYSTGDVIAAGTKFQDIFTKLFSGSATTYTISASVNPSGAGTVTGAGSYAAGTSINLEATASSGFTFSKWVKDDSTEYTTNPLPITVSGNASYTAEFVASVGSGMFGTFKTAEGADPVEVPTGVAPAGNMVADNAATKTASELTTIKAATTATKGYKQIFGVGGDLYTATFVCPVSMGEVKHIWAADAMGAQGSEETGSWLHTTVTIDGIQCYAYYYQSPTDDFTEYFSWVE